jgi:hypothetical protein
MIVVVCGHQGTIRLALLDCLIIPHKAVQPVDFESDEYVCKIAKRVDDAKILVEDGFDYVTDIEDMKLFRKRK